MAYVTQQSNVELMASLTGLTHDIFVGGVQNDVKRSSATAKLFQDAEPGEYRFAGQNMVFAADLRFKTGGVSTDGNVPDYVPLDAVQGQVTPIRRYERIALDNFVEKRSTGEGAFEDLGERIFNKLWDSWECMEVRQAIGPASGLVGKCSSRTSSTVFVIKDGYGHTATDPIQHLAEGSILAWWDVNVSGIAGAGKISSIAYSTNTITMDSGTTWEPSATLAEDDLIYFASTNNIDNDHFVSERNLAPNGLGTILDPDAAATTVHNISQTTYPRWKPYRKTSTTFDHIELTEHWLQIGPHRGFKVSPATDVVLTHPSCKAQLARSLMAFQQQTALGGELKGGYSDLAISGIPIEDDTFFYHDVCATISREHLFRIHLGGDADFFTDDGSMWDRIPNYDGKDAFVRDYMNYMSNHRGAHGALTGITVDVTVGDFSTTPNY